MTAKAVWEVVRRDGVAVMPRGWVEELHEMGEHWECRPGEFGCK